MTNDNEAKVISSKPGRGLRRDTPGYRLIYNRVIINPRCSVPDEAREAIMELAHYADQQMDRADTYMNQVFGVYERLGLGVIDENTHPLDVIRAIEKYADTVTTQYRELQQIGVAAENGEWEKAVHTFMEYFNHEAALIDDEVNSTLQTLRNVSIAEINTANELLRIAQEQGETWEVLEETADNMFNEWHDANTSPAEYVALSDEEVHQESVDAFLEIMGSSADEFEDEIWQEQVVAAQSTININNAIKSLSYLSDNEAKSFEAECMLEAWELEYTFEVGDHVTANRDITTDMLGIEDEIKEVIVKQGMEGVIVEMSDDDDEERIAVEWNIGDDDEMNSTHTETWSVDYMWLCLE